MSVKHSLEEAAQHALDWFSAYGLSDLPVAKHLRAAIRPSTNLAVTQVSGDKLTAIYELRDRTERHLILATMNVRRTAYAQYIEGIVVWRKPDYTSTYHEAFVNYLRVGNALPIIVDPVGSLVPLYTAFGFTKDERNILTLVC